MHPGNCLAAYCALAVMCGASRACRATNKAVGVCLHIYLERDFLSIESIVYPHSEHSLNSMRYQHAAAGFSRGWLEGPQLEKNCGRLKDVTDCFVQILLGCETAHDFFNFRQLLHALEKVHDFLCGSPEARRGRFVEFLQTIECAEKARQDQFANTCRRHNVTSNVWTKILRLEIGPEICPSLSTQRACLLEDGYLLHYCRHQPKVHMYAQVSGLFLYHWCRTPLLPGANNIPHSRQYGLTVLPSLSAVLTPLTLSYTLIALALLTASSYFL